MKKILSIIFSSIFLMSSAQAGGMIGVKAGFGELEGDRTQDAKFGTASGSVDHEYGAIFAEVETGAGFSVGLEYIPIEATIDTKATTAADSHANISDHKTLYVLVPFGNLYGKIGYSHADVSVTANYNDAGASSTVVNSHSDAIEGPMIGIGAQFDSPIPFLDVLRLETTYTDYDEMSITTTNTNGTADEDTKRGEATQLTFTIAIAKSF